MITDWLITVCKVAIQRDSLLLSLLFLITVRNAGNVVPHSQHFLDELTMCEPAALELGCVVNDIRHVIVCGHSDCKAMNLLYALRDEEFASIVCKYFSLMTD